ncbi:MAG: Maf family protein, partial [Muribaculaceae bacterium]|nr:Maf family protein [Muribaculaceae bacterium]
DYYIEKYAPMDKAGAYGIQEWIGYIGISGIKGCYYNVMGLPLHDLYRHLLQF